jgi:hypothetical protein
MMKTIYTYTLLSLFFLLSLNASFAQCTPASPIEVPSGNILGGSLFSEVTFSGAAGHDYFTFIADTSKAYIFSTHAAQSCEIFNIPNNDLQITIQDSLGNPVSGKYGQSFQDDYDISSGIYEPFLVWAPTYRGRYRMVLTKYHGGGCQELAYGDSVVAFFSTFDPMGNFAIYNEIHNSNWATVGNWVHYTGSGSIQSGKPADLKTYAVLMNGQRGATTVLPASDSCRALCIGAYNSTIDIPAQKSFEVFDTLLNEGFIKGNGDLIIHCDLDFTFNISVKEVVLKGDINGDKITISQYIGSPYFMDTLTIDNAKGVEIEGDFRVEWVKFKNGKVEIAPPTIPLYFFVLYITTGHSGASSQSYVVNSFGSVASNPFFGGSVKYLISTYGPGGYVIPVGSKTAYRPIKIDLAWGDSIGVEVFYGDSAFTRLHQDSSLSEVSSLEYWNISLDYSYTLPPFNDPEAKVALSWDGQSGVNSSDLVDLRVAGVDPNTNRWVNHGQTAISSSGNTGWITSAVTTFEKSFTLAAVNGSHALPIEGLDFNASQVTEGIKLSWLSAHLAEGSYSLEKSVDGNMFESIQFFASAYEMSEGTYLDSNPFHGFNYYRIKHIDQEGRTNFSNVVQELWQANKLAVNCFVSSQRQLIISYHLPEMREARLDILDLNGRQIFSQTISSHENQQVLDMSDWASGVYIVQLRQGGYFLTKKVKI